MFNSLDEATQASLLQSAQEAAEYERAWVAESREADQLATIKSHGVEVVENPDVDSLRAAVQSVTTLIRSTRTTSPGFRRCWLSNSAAPTFPLPKARGKRFFTP